MVAQKTYRYWRTAPATRGSGGPDEFGRSAKRGVRSELSKASLLGLDLNTKQVTLSILQHQIHFLACVGAEVEQ